MVNIRRQNKELTSQSDPEFASPFNPRSTVPRSTVPRSTVPRSTVPRSTVQAILDSATSGQSVLKSALQSVLDTGDQLIPKSTIQSILDSSTQVGPEWAPVPEQ
jgi:hypothetical protein